jgi:hypothetical protein
MAAICASKPLDWQSKAVATRHDLRVSDSGIHYSLEADDGIMTVTRWLVLDIALPIFFRPLRPLITRSFDKENVRTMAALKAYAEASPGR